MTLFREINRVILEENQQINIKFKDKFFKFIKDLDQIFGIFPNLKEQLKGGLIIPKDEKDKLINSLLDILKNTRHKLRQKKIYDISDEIRDKLRNLGINIEDD